MDVGLVRELGILTKVAAMSGLSGCDDKGVESDKLATGWHSSFECSYRKSLSYG